MRSWLKDNGIEMYSTHNDGKSVAAEKFIRTLKNKVYKYMTSISKNVNIGKLDKIMHKYNNTYHSTIKMKLFDVKDNTYIGFGKKIVMIKILNLKLVIMYKYQNTKTILQKAILV